MPPTPAAGRRDTGVQQTAHLRLRSDKAQGESATYEGTVRPTGWGWFPSDYRLVGFDAKGRARTLCFLLGDKSVWHPLVGERVRVSGRKYWTQACEYPTVGVTREERL